MFVTFPYFFIVELQNFLNASRTHIEMCCLNVRFIFYVNVGWFVLFKCSFYFLGEYGLVHFPPAHAPHHSILSIQIQTFHILLNMIL